MRNFGFAKSDMSNVPNAANFIIGEYLPLVYDITGECDEIVNQGDRGICVSVSMNDSILTMMKRKKQKYSQDIDYFYNQRKDKSIDGMQIKEAMEIAKKDKTISLYAKIQDIDTMKVSIMNNGACLVALPVNNMNEQFWKGKPNYGGHCITFVGWTKNSFILKNSWGKEYGNSGYTYFPYEDWRYLIEAWTIIN